MPHFIFTARNNFYKVRGFVQVEDKKKCKEMLADRGYTSIRLERLVNTTSIFGSMPSPQMRNIFDIDRKKLWYFKVIYAFLAVIFLTLIIKATVFGMGWLQTRNLYEKLGSEGLVAGGSIVSTYTVETRKPKGGIIKSPGFVYTFTDSAGKTHKGRIEENIPVPDYSNNWGAESGLFEFGEFGGTPHVGDAIEVTYFKDEPRFNVPYRLSGNGHIRERFNSQRIFDLFTAGCFLIYMLFMFGVIRTFEKRAKDAPLVKLAFEKFDASPGEDMIIEESELTKN
jgi:hypothetical protein